MGFRRCIDVRLARRNEQLARPQYAARPFLSHSIVPRLMSTDGWVCLVVFIRWCRPMQYMCTNGTLRRRALGEGSGRRKMPIFFCLCTLCNGTRNAKIELWGKRWNMLAPVIAMLTDLLHAIHVGLNGSKHIRHYTVLAYPLRVLRAIIIPSACIYGL